MPRSPMQLILATPVPPNEGCTGRSLWFRQPYVSVARHADEGGVIKSYLEFGVGVNQRCQTELAVGTRE